MASINDHFFQNNPLEIDNLPQFEAVQLNRLSRKYLMKLQVSTTVLLLILVAASVIAYLYVPGAKVFFPWIWIGLTLVFLLRYFNNYKLQKHNSFALRELDIIYKRGYFFERYTVIPFNRVQHVSTNRGVLDKLLNLSTLKVFTAGGSGSDVSIPGLLPEVANSLKEALSIRMSKHV